MRVRDDFLWLAPDVAPRRLASLRGADLAVARFEPVFRDKRGCGMLDLTFANATDAFALVGVLVDLVALWTLEAPPLVWPAPLAAAIDPSVARALEDRLLPWLRTLVRATATPAERIRAFGDEAPFRAAREDGLLGAIPYGAAIVALAPYAYARRFVRGARVRIDARDGALGAAYLRDRAVHISLASEPDARGVRWYGVGDLIGSEARADVAIVDRADGAPPAATLIVLDGSPPGGRIVEVPLPVPLDNGFTFDGADAPVVRTFGVRAPDGSPPVAAPAVRRLADAEGLIGIVMRPDAMYAPDGDTDEVEAIRALLAVEGLRSFVTVDPSDPALANADLIHAVGAYDDRHLLAAAATAQRSVKPLVIGLEPLAPYAAWHEDALAISLQIGLDRVDRAFYLAGYEQKRVAIDTAPLAADPAAVKANRERFGVLVRAAKAVITSDDPALVMRDFGVGGSTLVAGGIAVPAPSPEAAANLPIPPGPFVFMHAPLVRRSHLALVLAALGSLPVDVVIAGEPADVDTAIMLRKVAGRETVFLTDPTPALLEAIYARATVFVEPSLRPRSFSRVARAALAGALPLVVREGPFARMVGEDLHFPALDLGGVRDAIGRALARPDRAMRAKRLAISLGPMTDSLRVRRGILHAYSLAARSPVQASR